MRQAQTHDPIPTARIAPTARANAPHIICAVGIRVSDVLYVAARMRA
jgi:hypothetical protein